MGRRRIGQVVIPVKRYIDKHQDHVRRNVRKAHPAEPLPEPLTVAALRGEGLLRLGFFDLTESMGFGSQAQHKLYHHLIEHPARIADYAERIGLWRLVTRQYPGLEGARGTPDHESLAFWLYCGLIDDLERNNETQLLQTAREGLLRHYILGFYPQKPVDSTPKDAAALRQSAQVKLRKRWGLNTQLKESFDTEGEDPPVTFQLRFKPPGYSWHVLLERTGQRLKPTRLAAYEQLLAELQAGWHRPENARPSTGGDHGATDPSVAHHHHR